MRTTILRRGGAAVVAALLAAGALVASGPAPSARAAACPAGDGITVVVDFGTLGGGVQVRCVTEPVTSGFDALRKAGFTYTGAQRFPGLLCRINGQPADDPCVNAPPGDRYWAYWSASQPGGAWNYNDLGAGNRTPPPGSVDGWAFSDGCDRKPGSGPCPTSATTTTRPPASTTTTRSPAGGPSGTTPTTAGNPSTTVTDDPVTTDSRPGSDGAAGDASTTTTAPRGERAPAPGEAGDDETLAAGADGASGPGDEGGGSPAGAVVGLGAALALGGVGAAVARRRRATGEAEP